MLKLCRRVISITKRREVQDKTDEMIGYRHISGGGCLGLACNLAERL
jgi:hypothetical protein